MGAVNELSCLSFWQVKVVVGSDEVLILLSQLGSKQ